MKCVLINMAYFLVYGTPYYFCGDIETLNFKKLGKVISISSPDYPKCYYNKINHCPIYLNISTTRPVVLHIEYNTFTGADCFKPAYTLSNLSGQSLPNQIMRCSETLHSNDVLYKTNSPFMVQLALLRQNGIGFTLHVSGLV